MTVGPKRWVKFANCDPTVDLALIRFLARRTSAAITQSVIGAANL